MERDVESTRDSVIDPAPVSSALAADSVAPSSESLPPGPSKVFDERLFVVIHSATFVGIGAHALFIPLFAVAGVRELAIFNVGSVIAWGAARWLNLSQRQGFAVATISVEVVSHAALAVTLLGWGSGFQYYLVPLIPFLLFYSRASDRVLVSCAVVVAIVFIGLYYSAASPRMFMPERVADILALTNLVIPICTLGVVCYFYRRASLRAEGQMARLASRDPLTKLVNRRRILQCMAAERRRAEAGGRFSLVMADIDHFKKVNDAHGHDCGDAVLIEVARRLRRGVRHGDVVARWGGEEFLLLLPDTDVEVAGRVTERLREQISASPVEACGAALPVTMTFGVAEFQRGSELEHAVGQADEALYAGKNRGRNCVVVHGAGPRG